MEKAKQSYKQQTLHRFLSMQQSREEEKVEDHGSEDEHEEESVADQEDAEICETTGILTFGMNAPDKIDFFSLGMRMIDQSEEAASFKL
jgi:tartrate dehydratase alpha subunit/fumarate hydratase class I-like protein